MHRARVLDDRAYERDHNMNDTLKPKDHSEAVALFRASVIGSLGCREMSRGDLADELRALSEKRFRPPGSPITRSYGISTLERWYYAHRSGGVEALRPKPRSDRGFAQTLTDKQRELLCDIRQDYPGASVPLILRTLVADGRLQKDAVSAATLRRLYAQAGLDRRTLRMMGKGSRERQRWAVERPGQLWHADVCHGANLSVAGRAVRLRIHAILDDASRTIVAIRACNNEREVEMLSLLVEAVRLDGKPEVLYLDNGSTYRGDALKTACGRLDIKLLHAAPYDPQARGKMERFWRTLREGCLDLMGEMQSLHDVQARLLAFVDEHYHRAPHGGLMGRAPAEVYGEREPVHVTEETLRDSLVVHARRRVRGDGTIAIGGVDWELSQGYLAGKIVSIGRSFLDAREAPWVLHEEKRLQLAPVNPTANGKAKRRTHKPPRGIDAVPFRPADALLDKAMGRAPKAGAR
jgi:putative transposase